MLPDNISKIIEQRQQARMAKDWKKSDELRDVLLDKGYGIKDLPNNQFQVFALKKNLIER